MTTIKLNPETDFTPSQLRDWLNKTYSTKSTDRPFTNSDIYMYTKRGYLPDVYSGAKIEIVKTENIGIKVLRLTFKN